MCCSVLYALKPELKPQYVHQQVFLHTAIKQEKARTHHQENIWFFNHSLPTVLKKLLLLPVSLALFTNHLPQSHSVQPTLCLLQHQTCYALFILFIYLFIVLVILGQLKRVCCSLLKISYKKQQ